MYFIIKYTSKVLTSQKEYIKLPGGFWGGGFLCNTARFIFIYYHLFRSIDSYITETTVWMMVEVSQLNFDHCRFTILYDIPLYSFKCAIILLKYKPIFHPSKQLCMYRIINDTIRLLYTQRENWNLLFSVTYLSESVLCDKVLHGSYVWRASALPCNMFHFFFLPSPCLDVG